jgi:DNA modification methylase
VDRLVAGQPVRLVITDPPYNVSYEAKVADQATQSVRRATSRIENDSMEDVSFRQFLLDFYAQAYRVMAPGAAIYVFHADTEGLNFRAAFREAGFKLSGCLIWAKSSIVLGRSDYQWRHEPILYGWRPDGAHKWYGGRKKTTLATDLAGVTFQQESDGGLVITYTDGLRILSLRVREYEVLDNGLDAMSSVIYFEKPSSNDLHPTMKPVDLVAKLMRNSSKRGDLVADFFNGSGSTLIACEENGRRCCAMELEPFYCDQTVRRYMAYTQRDDVFLLRDGQRIPFSEVSRG